MTSSAMDRDFRDLGYVLMRASRSAPRHIRWQIRASHNHQVIVWECGGLDEVRSLLAAL